LHILRAFCLIMRLDADGLGHSAFGGVARRGCRFARRSAACGPHRLIRVARASMRRRQCSTVRRCFWKRAGLHPPFPAPFRLPLYRECWRCSFLAPPCSPPCLTRTGNGNPARNLGRNPPAAVCAPADARTGFLLTLTVHTTAENGRSSSDILSLRCERLSSSP
jgi:hypothetical protein